MSSVGALVPGSAFFVAGHRRLGAWVLAAFILIVGAAGYIFTAQRDMVLRLVVQPQWLTLLSIGCAALGLAWVSVILASHWMLRPRVLSRPERVVEACCLTVVCCAVMAPFVVAGNYSFAQKSFISDVFAPAADTKSATRPKQVTEKDPWGGRDHVSILLLGGDAGRYRTGIRTDSVMVATINTETGRTVLFSLPRNLEFVPFPEGNPLHKLYPNGFTGEGDPLEYMLNAVYGNVPALHPGVLGKSDNEGADALKLAVSGALGISIDYYALINLGGFIELVDAMGGVTVNVNEPIPIGGSEGVKEPEGYIAPGPNKELDGFHALWFARGRYGLDDYNRMRRQRCLVDAMIDEADLMTLVTRYKKILAAGREILETDIPAEILPPLVDLAGLVQDSKVRSVVFARSDRFSPSSPDYDFMHRTVQEALSFKRPGGKKPGDTADPLVEKPADSCAYDPVG
ncbi:MAG: LCP family protein [Actinomycetota bacterium]|nr:LCP family protein [Actinomycetota bacterium]